MTNVVKWRKWENPLANTIKKAIDTLFGLTASEARVYKVVPGDTLSGIASKMLGDVKRWPEIATLNGIDKPYRIFPDQIIKLPKDD